MKHTPGPWKTFNTQKGDTEIVAEPPNDHFWIARVQAATGRMPMVANARLIAAAPEMLEALQKLTGLIRTMENAYGNRGAKFLIQSDSFHLAETAIRKAEEGQ